MKAITWDLFVPWLLTAFARHVSCGQDRRAVQALPEPAASSGISYESLQHPMAAEQLLQLHRTIPLVINTGRIPLISHAVHAPIQYFMPHGGGGGGEDDGHRRHNGDKTAVRGHRPNDRRGSGARVDGRVRGDSRDESRDKVRDRARDKVEDKAPGPATIVVKPDAKSVEAELKKHYKNATTRSETLRRADRNGNVTRH